MPTPPVTLLLGTTKGAFLLAPDQARGTWDITGPHCDGWCINHMAGDPATGTIWAGGGGDFFGAGVWRSDDHGQTWQLTRLTRGQMDDWAANDADFAAMMGWSDTPLPFGTDFTQVWSLGYAHGTLYAGTKPAALLRSTDRGATWDRVDALTDHPSAKDWNPGAAGLVLHTIVFDPDTPEKQWIGISAAGVFATEDGGRTWDRRNRLSNAEACAHHDHPAGPRDGEPAIACTTSCAPGRADLLTSKTTMASGAPRWRAQLGRHHARPALDLRFPDPGASA
ncbi:MAG: WD40/YVTN/BNR-like repeat-containing protein [Roseovarius sp.]